MKLETIVTDITVVGGGLAGVCAAIAAARQGRTVALVQNRPVLGGNASSEVRVWVSGASATGTHRFARETGIMGELFVENQYRNPDGNPYYWDTVVLETVLAEPNIGLFLNTDVHEVEAEGSDDNRRIVSVTGWMMGSERKIRFESPVFIDCTGDGLVGFLAGASCRIGREARAEFGESWAPEVADDITLGSTLLFYTKDVGHPVKYVPPSFAKDITKTTIPERRIIRTGDSGCHYWWIEWGGELDTVHENERIRDELWAAIYGIWDYIKNSGKFDAGNLTLEWVGAVPGKREFRRFVGDYMLTQNDILRQEPFADRVAFGGWSIDLHPPQGMYAEASGSKHMYSDGIYHIPYRSLYSVNVSNMLMAGRNISASHVAFGTTRVMATCAIMGEAAGTAAALCAGKGVTPRDVYMHHLEELQQTLLRQDASLIGLANNDPLDRARNTTVSASSTLSALSVEEADEAFPLTSDVAMLFPVDPGIGRLELLVDAQAGTVLEVELWDTDRAENYVPHKLIVRDTVAVEPGERQWIPVNLPWRPAAPCNAFVIVRANESVSLWLSHRPLTGVLSFFRGRQPIVDPKLEEKQPSQPVVEWSMRKTVRKPFCFRAVDKTEAYTAERVIDGYTRPYGGPRMWVSEPMAEGGEEWLELQWPQEVPLSEVQLIWNDDVNEYLINLHYIRTSFDVMPELAADYRLEAWVGGEWRMLHRETDNRKRKKTHRFDSVSTARLRIVVERTNGCPRAELVEIRAYS
ncbi:FAD-dependent oxidoreductase [Paenibacillus mesophilus]|uniref:FAD-dependent oxidoreductase n=1 Tax=Paenibacillus mesophilus TaxID=2582849 RepID=UPI00110ED0E5|nr:FAD-dependent oxidoreductase [Paenibacillus mesophilus]TMV46435.1 FAD-dependent oxidoreductase [Paenibacillus mesophilus]